MSRVLIIATHASRTAKEADVLRGMIVGGCALALILAKVPLGF